MAQTNLMRADELVNGFNGVIDRKYWRATIAGTRLHPEVYFNSRATMVRVVYRVVTDDFTVTFSKTSAAFGDFVASAYRALSQVLAGLKAAGLPFVSPPENARPVLRIEYDPTTKTTVIHMARHGDEWTTAMPMPFKVPERNNSENLPQGLDLF
jgi:hypothetical protein